MALVIDTETTGFPDTPSYGKYFSYEDNSKYNSSRMVQISFMLCNEKLEQVEIKDYIVKVDCDIKNSNIHGITNEISTTKGVEFLEITVELLDMLKKVSHVIGHNLDFDINIILNELHRIDCFSVIEELKKKTHFCTMKQTKNIVNAKNTYGIKDPKLEELYDFAIGRKMENSHNSKYDVINTHVALKKLIDTKRVTLLLENLIYTPIVSKNKNVL